MMKKNKCLFVLAALLMACTGMRIERTLKTADALRGEQQYEAALTYYKDLVQRFPNRTELVGIYLRMGDLYFYNLKQYPEAEASYHLILQRWPLTPEAGLSYAHLAELYAHEERFDRAIEMLESLLKYYPNHPDSVGLMRQIGLLYLQMKNYPQARLEFEKTLKQPSLDTTQRAQILYDIGETYFLEGSDARAETFYRQVMTMVSGTELAQSAEKQIKASIEEKNAGKAGQRSILPWDRKQAPHEEPHGEAHEESNE